MISIATGGYWISLESARKTISNKDWERLFRRDSCNEWSVTYQIAEIGYCPPSLQCEARSGSRWVGAGTGTYWHESKYLEVDLVPNPLDRPAVSRVWCSMCENNQFQFPVCGLPLILYRVAFHVAQKAKEVVFTMSLRPPLWLATRFM